MGSGSDTISISTNADGVIGYSNTNAGSHLNSYSDIYRYNHSNYHNNEYSSRNWYGYSQSSSEGNYDYKSEGEYTNQGQSNWDNEYSRTYRFGVSIGADNSSIDAGNGDNNINLLAVGGELAIALAGSSISAGRGDDSLSIIGLAEGEESYINRNKSDSTWSHDSWYSNRRSEEYSRSYTSAYYWYNRIEEYSRNHESESDGFSSSRSTYNRDYEYSRINRFGTAYGAKNSTINLGNGDNEASISANGGERAEALSNSSLETGKGDDVISLSATALGQKSLIDQNKYLSEYSSEYSHQSDYLSQGEGTYQTRYGWGWWSPIRENTYSYNYSGSNQSEGKHQSLWVQDYENSFIQKLGSAIGANGSTIITGSGDDLLTVDSQGYTESVGIKDSSIDLGKGDDVFTINSSAFGYTSYLRRNLGSYDYSYNYQSAGNQSGKYSNSYRYSYPWWSYGWEYSGSYDYEWNYGYQHSGSGSWTYNEYSWLLNTGVAKGAVNSTIETGNGDDSVSITATASSSATALESSELINRRWRRLG